jgi:hypothetical protein
MADFGSLPLPIELKNALDEETSGNVERGSDVHTDVAGEINAVTEKISPAGNDELLLEDSAANFAKKKAKIKNIVGIAFAEIYENDASTPQSIPDGITYTKLTHFVTNGLSQNCTPDAANDKITITKPGIYKVSCSLNFSAGAAASTWRIAIFLDGVEQNNCHIMRKIAAAGDTGSASVTGFIDVTSANLDVDVRARHDEGSSTNITIVYANLNVYYLAST